MEKGTDLFLVKNKSVLFSSRVLLNVVAKEPKAVLRALSGRKN